MYGSLKPQPGRFPSCGAGSHGRRPLTLHRVSSHNTRCGEICDQSAARTRARTARTAPHSTALRRQPLRAGSR
eukprot:3508808-Prymnesium_polylepis.1